MKTSKRVKIADLKANLSRHLREVRSGETITVFDRDSPIALLTPLGGASTESISIRPPMSDPKKIGSVGSPIKRRLEFSSLEILAALRGDK